MLMRTTSLSRRRLALADGVLAIWTATWIVLGVLIATEVRGLADLSATVTKAGVAVEVSADALHRLEALPLVGGQIAGPADRVGEAGRAAQQSGRSSRGSVRRLSVLLGIAIAIVPSAPLLLYVPWRLAVARDRRGLRRAVEEGGLEDPVLLEVLARRAAQHLPYGQLRRASPDPWADIREGRFHALASVELERLGVAQRPRRPRAVRA